MGNGCSSSKKMDDPRSKNYKREKIKERTPEPWSVYENEAFLEYFKTKTRNMYQCIVCGKTLGLKGPRTYVWGQPHCKVHKSDGSIWCTGCYKFEYNDGPYFKLSDGRHLCPKCFPTAVLDNKKLEFIIREVHKFYKGLDLKINLDFSIFMVAQNQISKKKPLAVGATVLKPQVVDRVDQCFVRGQKIEAITSRQQLSNHLVHGILLPFGRPEVMISSTLAHEMMHAWLRSRGYKHANRNVEEAICEMMVYKWLDRLEQFETNPFLRLLLRIRKARAETKFYREFREGKEAIDMYGLKFVVHEILKTGNFPKMQL